MTAAQPTALQHHLKRLADMRLQCRALIAVGVGCIGCIGAGDRRLDVMPATHLLEDFPDRGPLALTDVVPRKSLPLENSDAESWLLFLQQRPGGGAGRTPANNCDV